jgi:hypothetical protein
MAAEPAKKGLDFWTFYSRWRGAGRNGGTAAKGSGVLGTAGASTVTRDSFEGGWIGSECNGGSVEPPDRDRGKMSGVRWAEDGYKTRQESGYKPRQATFCIR